MQATKIREGQQLRLKSARRDAYGLTEWYVTVARIGYRNGYKTPWLYDDTGRAFRPSDFERAVAIPY